MNATFLLLEMSFNKILMPRNLALIAFLALSVFSSCKKDNHSIADCFTNTATIRQITNKQAVIKFIDRQFYIVEEAAIDTKLNPCNLAQAFQVADLQVIISGEVKATATNGAGPCCTENFVITKITL